MRIFFKKMILFWSCVKNLRLVIELWYLEEGFWVSVQGFFKKKIVKKKSHGPIMPIYT
jgi:hypothetical protein